MITIRTNTEYWFCQHGVIYTANFTGSKPDMDRLRDGNFFLVREAALEYHRWLCGHFNRLLKGVTINA